MDKEYSVKVDDNYHSMDESERYDDASDRMLGQAIERCKAITMASLKACYEKGIDANKLHAQWLMFGDDPSIVGAEKGSPPFSAREFVTEELCRGVIAEIEKCS